MEEDILKPVPLNEFCHHVEKRRKAVIEIENFFESEPFFALHERTVFNL